MQPEACLRLSHTLWAQLTGGLHRRTEGRHESGAFLLGRRRRTEREATAVVYYEELDPGAYNTGVCVLHAEAFGQLWDRCSALALSVVADAHVHSLRAVQSRFDKENPMIARPGHLALIFPLMARPPIQRRSVGVYEYLGDHRWCSHGGRHVSRVLKIVDN